MLIYKTFWLVLKILAQHYFDDYLGLTITFYGKIKVAFLPFILQEFMALVEDFGASAND